MTTKPSHTAKAALAPGERPTLKTIAALVGMSVPTVSRALSDAPDIGKSTKEKVRAVAAELGYQPNRAGLRLRTGKTNVIALVLRTDNDGMNSNTAELITSIASTLRNTPYHVIVIPYFPDESPMNPIRYIVQTRSADGVILNRIQPDDPRVALLQKSGIAVATYGRTLNCENEAYYDFDNEVFGANCVEQLVKRGRKNFLLIAPPREQSYSGHLIQGATDAAVRSGAKMAILDGADNDSNNAELVAALTTKLTQSPEIDGVICPAARAAVSTTLALETLGRHLGQDIDIVAKEAVPFLRAFREDIVVVSEDVGRAGSFLARAVTHAIDSPSQPPMQSLDKRVSPTD